KWVGGISALTWAPSLVTFPAPDAGPLGVVPQVSRARSSLNRASDPSEEVAGRAREGPPRTGKPRAPSSFAIPSARLIGDIGAKPSLGLTLAGDLTSPAALRDRAAPEPPPSLPPP